MALAKALTELIEQVVGFEDSIQGLTDTLASWSADQRRTLHDTAESLKTRLSDLEERNIDTALMVERQGKLLAAVTGELSTLRSQAGAEATQNKLDRVQSMLAASMSEVESRVARNLDECAQDIHRSLDNRLESQDRQQQNAQQELGRVRETISSLTERCEQLVGEWTQYRRSLEQRSTTSGL